MKLRNALVFALLAGVFTGVMTSAQEANEVSAPIAEKKPTRLEAHGDVRIDDYYWLRERENLEVIEYLNAENAYFQHSMSDVSDLEAKLFAESKARLKQDDASVPYRDGNAWYYTRYEEGKQYPIYCRASSRDQSDEEIILDANTLAEGHSFCSVRGVQVSEDGDRLAFAIDTVGRRKYSLRFKVLSSGEMLKDEIAGVTANVVWANDNQHVFYTRQDPETLRSYQVYRHKLGTDPADDVLIYEEQDETFRCRVSKTRSKQYLLISSSQTLSDEWRFLDASNPTGDFQVVQPRERDLEYSVEHLGDHFYIRTNWNAENFCLVKAPCSDPDQENWEVLVPSSTESYLQSFLLFDDFLVLQNRVEGLTQIRVEPFGEEEGYELEFDEPAYSVRFNVNRDVDTDQLRFSYTSMTTPSSIYEYSLRTKERELLKQTPVLGGFDSSNYKTERLWAEARDGARVPISVVYRKGTRIDGSAPLMLYAYGSYGSSMDASFSSDRLNLLDRGFVYAIAHVRGGQEMGRHWYEDGKLLNKKNTFTDFIDAAEFLVEHEYGAPTRMYARGGSAGGLLIGAVVNMRPDLFHGVIADVPFVDVVTTMLDDSIPLTTNEYDEWGNPNDRTSYDYMLSYSPYDNVQATDYPHMLVTTGLHDSQVQYWEPAKWVAKLRERKTDENLLLMKTNMDAGHGGASGRFNRLHEVAFRHAFILKLASMEQ